MFTINKFSQRWIFYFPHVKETAYRATHIRRNLITTYFHRYRLPRCFELKYKIIALIKVWCTTSLAINVIFIRMFVREPPKAVSVKGSVLFNDHLKCGMAKIKLYIYYFLATHPAFHYNKYLKVSLFASHYVFRFHCQQFL